MPTEEEYGKWKVTDLKAELKRRAVPQTGLKLKKDFIDKLVELDQNAAEASEEGPGGRDTESGGREVQVDEPREQEHEQEQEQQQQEKTEDVVETEQPETVDVAADANGSMSKQERSTLQESKMEQEEKPHEETTANEEKEDVPPTQKDDTPPPMQKPDAAQTDSESQSTVEKAPGDVSRASTTATDVVEDMNKRKRRSQSPPPSLETVKKAKIDNDQPRIIMKEIAEEPTDIPERTAVIEGDDEKVLSRESMSTTSAEDKGRQAREEKMDEMDVDKPGSGQDTKQIELQKSPESVPSRQDARFKNLFSSTSQDNRPPPTPEAELDAERTVTPALHPATSALYVRNFMRPLQPILLKEHLISLASPPQSDPDPSVLVEFFLDSIKTHAFVQFTSTAAASRVRSALHDTVWPNERNRNALWVDFIPEDKLQTWIRLEQDSTTSRGGPRWEVIYDETDDGIKAVLREAGPLGARPAPRESGKPKTQEPNIPTGPRASFEVGRRRSSQAQPPQGISQSRGGGGTGFKALDDLFKSTKTKPKLYYLPVARELVDRRLDRFDDIAERGPRPRRGGGDETRRFTFEDGDVFVDGGAEYGPRAVARMAARRRGGGGGGGDSWRGR